MISRYSLQGLSLALLSLLVIPHHLSAAGVIGDDRGRPVARQHEESGDSPQATLRAHQEEGIVWGIDLLLCVAGAKLNGATISEAVGMCGEESVQSGSP